jgi:HPt (histidine-containing phosphotransfer) domain-containing protein
VAGLIPRFLASCDSRLAEVEEALKQGDFVRVRNHAHALRGSGGAFGFDRISEQAAQLEEAAIGGQMDQMTAAMTALRRVLAETKP